MREKSLLISSVGRPLGRGAAGAKQSPRNPRGITRAIASRQAAGERETYAAFAARACSELPHS